MINTQDIFPQSRYRHCHNVGLRMYDYAKKRLKWSEQKCQEMFILGCLHDIGYEFDEDSHFHSVEMSKVLESCKYKYASEILHHSWVPEDTEGCDISKISPEIRLLYFGDMTVDGMGNWCTLDERLSDLENRHGKNSDVYKESVAIAGALMKWGFDDTLPKKPILKIHDQFYPKKPTTVEKGADGLTKGQAYIKYNCIEELGHEEAVRYSLKELLSIFEKANKISIPVKILLDSPIYPRNAELYDAFTDEYGFWVDGYLGYIVKRSGGDFEFDSSIINGEYIDYLVKYY